MTPALEKRSYDDLEDLIELPLDGDVKPEEVEEEEKENAKPEEEEEKEEYENPLLQPGRLAKVGTRNSKLYDRHPLM